MINEEEEKGETIYEAASIVTGAIRGEVGVQVRIYIQERGSRGSKASAHCGFRGGRCS